MKHHTGAVLSSAWPSCDGTVAFMDRYVKQRIAIRYWLAGAGFNTALEAMTFAEGFHQGTRKDGVTPEFAHQVAIAGYVRTLAPHLEFPEDTLTAVFLHDVREDYHISDVEIVTRFGARVAEAVDAMTKEFAGRRRDPRSVFDAIAASPVASVAKGADRINNQSSMVGVFSRDKMASYVAETREFFFPMLKEARRMFPRQEAAYENIKLVLENQVALVDELLGTSAP